jgi:hypothetical protein
MAPATQDPGDDHGHRGDWPLVLLLSVLLAGAAVIALAGGGPTRAVGAPVAVRTGWAGFPDERVTLIRTLAAPVLACVDRVDPRAADSPMFHGCGDWHNAVAAHHALYTAYRRTGDVAYLRAAERRLAVERIEPELAFLPRLAEPRDLRRHYGFPWLLAMLEQRAAALSLARERGESTDTEPDLRPLADAAVAWLRDRLTRLDPATGRQDALSDQYLNLSWTVINLARWARHAEDADLLRTVRAAADAHLRPVALDAACPVERDARPDAGQFIPPCLMRLAAIAVLDGPAARDWLAARLPAGFTVPVLTGPRTAEAAGLNFHRAATLAILHAATGRAELRDNHATLVRAHTARPYEWRDDYRNHAQWIPQFGIHAIEQSYPD